MTGHYLGGGGGVLLDSEKESAKKLCLKTATNPSHRFADHSNN